MGWLPQDDYTQARNLALFGASMRDAYFGTNEQPHVRNAFAGINVGALDASYPAPPSTLTERARRRPRPAA